ncbi:BTAD domain-containing putative transcriptional regulator [Microvirga calopogonii]|uniref:BTAD domain-containing putative transcriptional regulator n=1 Tax=Microvirga calopogonii TaxID=2078013 RepID=UPI0013B463AB|nr:BTAD domain-containing putative transcriptional regulator [Microvirga calopogonii]
MDQPDVTVRVLGIPEFGLPSPGRVFPVKGFQLLALLASSSSHKMTRKQIASLLWDSRNEAVALANLRQLLARIRQAAKNTELISSSVEEVELGKDAAQIDVISFFISLEHHSPAKWEQALHLFRGDLLEGINEATDEFLYWLTSYRELLRERFFSAASTALLEWTRYGNASSDRLRDLARRMVTLDPQREATYRLLIEAYGRNSMFDDVELTLKALEAVLLREHNDRPSKETMAVARRVLSWRSSYEHESAPTPSTHSAPRVAFLAPIHIEGGRIGGIVGALIEEVANELSRYRSIAVLAPHSSFQVDHDSGLPRDNSLLRCDYSVSGFIRRNRSSTVLSLRMTEWNSLQIVWAAQFEIDPSTLLKSFELIVARVASSLASAIEQETLRKLLSTKSHEAYLSFLNGERSLLNCDLPRLRRARSDFWRAAQADPMFSPARARIATTLYLEWIQLGGTDPQLLTTAQEQAAFAAKLDPNSALGHWTLATVALYQRDFDTCEAKFAEAASLCPNSAELLVQHADALAHLGDPDAGWSRFERALDLNPLPPDRYWWAGASIAFRQKRYTTVVELCGKLASDESALGILAASHAYLGDLRTARAYGRRHKEIYPGSTAYEKSTVGPDRLAEHREHRLHGLRMAGIL